MSWNKENLEECLKYWLQDRATKLYSGLPSIFTSNIWWARNNAVFNDKFMPPEVTTNITLNQAVEFREDPKALKTRLPVLPTIDYEVPWGYFDGASQGHPPMCGVGVVLYIKQNHYIHIRYAPGTRSNNRAEFIALWTLLETTIKKDARKLQVFGDSKLVIDWANGKNSAQDIRLANIMRDIKLTFQSFEWLSFHHILWKLNSKADELSKEALLLPVGAFGYYEFIEGEEVEAMEFRL
jgi:ribonuclease HI